MDGKAGALLLRSFLGREKIARYRGTSDLAE
jgi:hypothetical protein